MTTFASTMRRLMSSQLLDISQPFIHLASQSVNIMAVPTQNIPANTVYRFSLLLPTANFSDFIHLITMSSIPDSHSKNTSHQTAATARSKKSLISRLGSAW